MFVSNFLPHVGGVEYFVHDLANAFKRSWDDEIHIVCFDESESFYEQKSDYIVHRIRRIFIISGVFAVPHPISLIKGIVNLFKTRGRPDFIWTHTRFFVSSLIGSLLAHLLRVKTIHVEHGTTFVAHSNPIIALCSRIWDHTFGRAVIATANQLIVVAPEGLKFVKLLGGKNAQYVPAGVHADEWINSSIEEAQPPNEHPRLLFVGRLLPGKGVTILLEAMAKVITEHVTLDVIGSGPHRSELEKTSKSLGLEQRVHFHGTIERSKLPYWYSKSTLFVNPSLSEGGPLTVLEALATGLPVVTTPVGCVADYIQASDGYGIITKDFSHLEVGNAVIEALKKFKNCDRNRCSENTIRAFSWSSRAKQIREKVVKS